MYVLLLNQTFYPDVVATAQHAHDLAKHLVANGHEVVVVTSRSIYGQRGAALPRYQIVDGVEVRRVGASLFGKSSILFRVVDFLLFYILAAIKCFTIKRPDVVVTFTTPPLIALVGWMLKVTKRCAFVYWIMDLYPDLPVACGVIQERSLLTRFLERVNRFCIHHADKAVVLGRCMQQRVLDKGIAAEKLVHINPWSDATELDPIPAETNPYLREWNLRDKFVVMYSGNLGLGHESRTMCQAMELLKDREDIRFVFVGGGKRMAEVMQFVVEKKLTNAKIYPYQPREKLSASLAAADVHLISLATNVCGIMVPSKVFGIMAVGRPAIFIGPPESEIARVLVENDAGRVVACGDSESLVREIAELAANHRKLEQMGANARRAVHEKYDRKYTVAQWEDLLQSVTHAKAVEHRAVAQGS